MSNIKKIVLIIIFILILILTGAFINRAPVSSMNDSRILMDTDITLTLYGNDLEEANEEVFNLFSSIGEISDAYKQYDGVNNIYNINQNENEGPIYLGEDLFSQIKKGISYYEPSGGEYNIGLFSLVELWKSCEVENRLPSEEEIRDIIEGSDISSIQLNEADLTMVRSSEVKFDLGSLTKGYSIDKVYELLSDNENISGALIDAGGNIKVLGEKNDGSREYKIGLQDPSDLGNILGVVSLSDGDAISTSGNYNRFYVIDGESYSHILSGTSGFPPSYFKSVTVLTSNGLDSDILSTIFYLLPLDKGMEFLASLDFEVEVLWVDMDNNIHKSAGFPIEWKNIEGYTYEE